MRHHLRTLTVKTHVVAGDSVDEIDISATLRTLLATTPYEVDVDLTESGDMQFNLFQTGQQWDMREDHVALALTYQEAGTLTAVVEQMQASLLKAGNGAELVRRLAQTGCPAEVVRTIKEAQAAMGNTAADWPSGTATPRR